MNKTTVYYHHDGIIECIVGSEESLSEYNVRDDLIKGYIKDDDDIQKIKDGKASLTNFIIENVDAGDKPNTNGKVTIIKENSDICPKLNPSKNAVLSS